jgi:hypothetical protein
MVAIIGTTEFMTTFDNKKLQPIFIGGCDRSGTTMLGALLGSHCDVYCPPEMGFMTNIALRELEDPSQRRCWIDSFVNDEKFIHWLKSDWRELKTLTTFYEFYSTLIVHHCRTAGSNKDFRFVVDHYPRTIAHARRWKKIYPDSKFIHIIRDGRAIANSFSQLKWGPSGMRSSAYYWSSQFALCSSQQRHLGPDYFEVRYEDLVLNEVSVCSSILRFLGLDPSGFKADKEVHAVTTYNSKQHSLVGRPAQSSKVNEWELKLSKKDILCFEYYAGSLLDSLGYKLVNNVPLSRPGIFYSFYDTYFRYLLKRPFQSIHRWFRLRF